MSSDLEKEIGAAAREGVAKAVEAAISGYNSPLTKLADECVGRRAPELEELIGGALDEAIAEPEFRQAVLDAIRAKFARTLVAKLGGEIEARVNDLKSRPVTRARLTLALGAMLEEFESEKDAADG